MQSAIHHDRRRRRLVNERKEERGEEKEEHIKPMEEGGTGLSVKRCVRQ